MNNPVWVKVVCIVSIVLGALGLLTAASGIVYSLMAEQAQDSTLRWMQAMAGGGLPPEIQKIQAELMDDTVAIQKRWLPINLALLCGNLVVASTLLAGGILALRKKAIGRKLLLVAFVMAAVFEIVRVVPTSMMQWEISKLMTPYMQRFMDASVPKGAAMPPAQRKTMQTVMRSSLAVGVLIGVLTALGMAVVKIAFYLGGVWLFRKPHVVAMYAQGGTALDGVA